MYVALQSSMHDDIHCSTSGSGITSLQLLERWTSPRFSKGPSPHGAMVDTCDVADWVRGHDLPSSQETPEVTSRRDGGMKPPADRYRGEAQL
jgi:hypothetical protein